MEQKQTWGLIFAVADRDKYEGLNEIKTLMSKV